MTRFAILGTSFLLLLLPLNSFVEAYYRDPYSGSSYLDLGIHAGKCEDFERNISLNFSKVGFQSLGDRFVDSPDVSCLDLSHNEITAISTDAFAGLPNLLYLNLAHIKNLQSGCSERLFSTSQLKNLKTLVLDETCVDSDSYNRLPQITISTLENLYFRRVNLNEIGRSLVYSFPKLVGLYLSYNRLGTNMNIFWGGLPKTLTHLYLDYNEFTQFKCEELDHVTHLVLNGNRLNTLCFQFEPYCGLSLQGAPSLAFLNLSRSEVTEINSDTFDNCSRLVTLDLSHNSIRSIKKNTFDYTTLLEELYLEGNALQSVPDLSKATNLRKLFLGSNRIQHLSEESLSNLPMLKELSLGNNSLTSVDERTFHKLTMLEYLDLANNDLLMLPSGWMPVDNSLRVLNLQRNSFNNFENLAIEFGLNLTDIYLQGNPVTSLNTRDLTYLPNNVTIHLGNECKAGTRTETEKGWEPKQEPIDMTLQTEPPSSYEPKWYRQSYRGNI